MTTQAYCIMCSGRPSLVFDVAATDRERIPSRYMPIAIAGGSSTNFFNELALYQNRQCVFQAVPLSTAGIEIASVRKAGDGDRVVPVHEFDLNNDDVYCEYYDEADGYDLLGIKQDIAERTAALLAIGNHLRSVAASAPAPRSACR